MDRAQLNARNSQASQGCVTVIHTHVSSDTNQLPDEEILKPRDFAPFFTRRGVVELCALHDTHDGSDYGFFPPAGILAHQPESNPREEGQAPAQGALGGPILPAIRPPAIIENRCDVGGPR